MFHCKTTRARQPQATEGYALGSLAGRAGIACKAGQASESRCGDETQHKALQWLRSSMMSNFFSAPAVNPAWTGGMHVINHALSSIDQLPPSDIDYPHFIALLTLIDTSVASKLQQQ